MKFYMDHNNINVRDLAASLAFYEKALGLTPLRENVAADGSFKIVYLTDGATAWKLELTWLKEHPEPYDLGENEIHLAFVTEDYDAAYALHKEMGCICFENPAMGIYFIEDPDGYWLEVLPRR